MAAFSPLGRLTGVVFVSRAAALGLQVCLSVMRTAAEYSTCGSHRKVQKLESGYRR